MILASVVMEPITSFVLTEVVLVVFLFALLFVHKFYDSSHGRKRLRKGLEDVKSSERDATRLQYCNNESTDVDSETASTSASEASSSESRSVNPNGYGPKALLSGQKETVRGNAKDLNAESTQFLRNDVGRDRHQDKRFHKIGACFEGGVPASLREIVSRGIKRELRREREREQNKCQKNGTIDKMQQILRKLTPEDAAVINNAFEANENDLQASPFPHAIKDRTDTLGLTLRKLGSVDPNRVIMVSRLTKLGSNSAQVLKTHFSKYGVVANVYVPQPMVTPARIGFIVMEKVDDVVNIFKEGLEHTVKGIVIGVTAYEHHVPEDVIRNESKSWLPGLCEDINKPRGGRFPTYANMTEDNTMRANIQKLRQIDARRILHVKRLHKLGLGSAQLLRTHFGQFGNVANVFVTHRIDRRKIDVENPKARPLLRPAGVGFVVMDKPEDVDAILQSEVAHIVYGVSIAIFRYVHNFSE